MRNVISKRWSVKASCLLLALAAAASLQPAACQRQVPPTIGPARPASANGSSRQAAARGSGSLGCPPATAELSAPGCPCTMQHGGLEASNSSSSKQPSNLCPAGYRCSPSAAAAILQAGWQYGADTSHSIMSLPALGPAVSALTLSAAKDGICVPCQMGEYCAQGTQEETWMSISRCEMDSAVLNPGNAAASVGNNTGLRLRKGARARRASSAPDPTAQAGGCRGVRMCPEGSYCPNATVAKPCEPGRWCPEGSVASQPCNISNLLAWNPFRSVRRSPEPMLEALVRASQPLDGTMCPANASDPLAGCLPGFFCPTAAVMKPCPVGFYCPGHNSAPWPCPVLASCLSPSMEHPDWSWMGVVFMLLLLLVMMTVLEYVHMRGRCCRQAVTQEDEVMQLMEAVGFKIVGTYGAYSVSRAAGAPHITKHHFRHHLQETAHLAHKPLQRAWRAWQFLTRRRGGAQPSTKADAADDAKGAAAANSAGGHAVVNIGAVNGGSKQPWGLFGHRGSSSKATDLPSPAAPGTPSSQDASAHSAKVWTGLDGAASAKASVMASTVAEEDAGEAEYLINPRLALLFSDVWVAGGAISGGLRQRLVCTAKRVCCGSGTKTSDDFEEGAVDGKGAAAADVDKAGLQRKQQCNLDAAAAAGAYFIVPGVSSYFAHSQLHAIMGPSGCGKTTLCRALAGRLPMSHVCGDIRVLCSSAADSFQSQTELVMAEAAFGASATSCNISHMTGFVPQFDLLHESLTVLENLELAAAMRLPLSITGDDAHGCLTHRGQRNREEKKVVGEVMALMALSKLQHKVVGTSSARILSGGQRKRVAIAIELVAKPSVLWLDEPTSGLDAAVAYDVVEALKASADRGMNVLAVMHQPRSTIFNLFDSCLLLGPSGHVVYSGPQHLALHYMAFLGFYMRPNENMADFLLDVIAGVVPRPGDPDYIPSQLATMWNKAGNVWVQQQLREAQRRRERHPDGHHAEAACLAALLPVPPASTPPVDWPWRPRDLEALLSRFDLLVDAADAQPGRSSRRSGASSHHGVAAVLSYEGFLTFWDESGLKELLGEEQFADFIAGLCEDFGMTPDTCITQGHFVDLLKAQLRAAAATAAAPGGDQLHATPSGPAAAEPVDGMLAACNSSLPGISEVPGTEAADSTAAPGPSNPMTRQSAFAAYAANSSAACAITEEEEAEAQQLLDAVSPLPQSTRHRLVSASTAPPRSSFDGEPGLTVAGTPVPSTAAGACAATAAALACESEAAAAAACDLYEAAAAADDAATAACQTVATAAAIAAGLSAERDPFAAAAASPLLGANMSAPVPPSCTMTPATSLADTTSVVPGALMCPEARMKQHAFRRQLSRRVSLAHRDEPVPAESLQQQQQCHMQALMKCRKARQAAMAVAQQHAGLRQLSQARLMRPGSFMGVRAPSASPCTSVEEARARCLGELGDFVLAQHMQELQQLPVAGSFQLSAMPAPGVRLGHGATLGAAASLQPAAAALRAPGMSFCSLGKAGTLATEPGTVLQADDSVVARPSTAGSKAAAAAVRDSAEHEAAAAVKSRKLPPVLRQLQLVVKRSFWKAMLARSGFMTDLLLTSVLGMALGVAQGRNNEPSMSLLWMLITLLAYGCMTLVRSTRCYGHERHLYLQQESPAGVSVTAWVLGHQLYELLGLFLHPLTFFAWIYVLTLTPVPTWSYYSTLLVVGFYTSGLGYLVSLSVSSNNAMLAALAVGVIFGGVANGVQPKMWELEPSHPVLWLDALSYTRWGLQAIYISWLTPAPAVRAPSTAVFLSGLGFCGLEPSLMQALNKREVPGQPQGPAFSSNRVEHMLANQTWWNMSSSARAGALAAAAQSNMQEQRDSTRAAGIAAISQLWQYYNNPALLDDQCQHQQTKAFVCLTVLGVGCRLLVWLLVKYKVMRKAHE